MRVLLVDGQWNLKRNFHQTALRLDANKDNCNAVYGFLVSLQSAISKILPDRVIVFWDGFHAGKLRYAIYPPYKANREKHWEDEERAIREEMDVEDEEGKKKYDLLIQKIKVQNILEDLYVRQLEVDYIEADDLVGQYILMNPEDDVVVFCRDKDFYQLISEKVSIKSPDFQSLITHKNFKQIFGHSLDNQLLFRCFEGDDSDEIEGVNGITRNTLIKYFPSITDQKYTFNRLIEECYELKKDKKHKKSKTLEKIINSKEIVYRNAKLMNLKKPFVNDCALSKLEEISNSPLDFGSRSVSKARLNFVRDGYAKYFSHENRDLDSFFSVFHLLSNKEKEFLNKFQQSKK